MSVFRYKMSVIVIKRRINYNKLLGIQFYVHHCNPQNNVYYYITKINILFFKT